MKDKEVLYKLLFELLIQFRERGKELDDKKIFHLSNLFHKIPLKLFNVDNDNDYAEILNYLKSNCRNYDLGLWVKEISKRYDDFPFLESDWFDDEKTK